MKWFWNRGPLTRLVLVLVSFLTPTFLLWRLLDSQGLSAFLSHITVVLAIPAAVVAFLVAIRLSLLEPDAAAGWFDRRRADLAAGLANMLRLIAELPAFTYTEINRHDKRFNTKHGKQVPYRSFIQWLIMGIGELISLGTAFLVLTVFLSLAAPPSPRLKRQHLEHAPVRVNHSHEHRDLDAKQGSVAAAEVPGSKEAMLHDVYLCERCRQQLSWYHRFSSNFTFIRFEEAAARNAVSSANHEPQPYDRPWTQVGLAMLQLANIGILVLSANAVLEIGLLIEEPGVEHVRRVLALSFTGMALYLIKEYPINHDTTEFLLGCLSGMIAAILWLMHPFQKFLFRLRRIEHVQRPSKPPARQEELGSQ